MSARSEGFTVEEFVAVVRGFQRDCSQPDPDPRRTGSDFFGGAQHKFGLGLCVARI